MNLGFNPRYVMLSSPADSAGAAVSSDVIGCKELHDIDLLVLAGTITGDSIVVTVEECDDTTPSNTSAIAFKYRKGAAVGTDEDGDVSDATSSGVTLAATDDDKLLTISVDPASLSDGYPYLRVVATPGGSATASEIAILAVVKPRYASESNVSLVD